MAIAVMAAVVLAVSVGVADRSRRSADTARQFQVDFYRAQALAERLRGLTYQGIDGDRIDDAILTDGFRTRDELVPLLRRLRPHATDPAAFDPVLQANAALDPIVARALRAARANPIDWSQVQALSQRSFRPILRRLTQVTAAQAQLQDRRAERATRIANGAFLGAFLLGVPLVGFLAYSFERVARQRKLTGEADAIREASEERLRALSEHTTDAVVILDRELEPVWQGGSMERAFGFSVEELRHHGPFTDVIDAADRTAVERTLRQLMARPPGSTAVTTVRMRDAAGRERAVELVAGNRFATPSIGGLLVGIRDVSEQRALEAEIGRQAFHDSTTGLLNRAGFARALAPRIEDTTSDDPLTVIALDMIDFAIVNESLGHDVGDELLAALGDRLAGAVRAPDLAGRIGGDEFAVVLHGASRTARARATRLLEELELPVELGARTLRPELRAGIAVAQPSDTTSDLLRNADIAMSAAKAHQTDRIALFTRAMHDDVMSQLELVVELRDAIDTKGLFLEYQPIVDLGSGRVTGAEALVRWEHPERGRLAPGAFVPLAERTGLIAPLGWWVLATACRQMSSWVQTGVAGPDQYVSVNVSALQLAEPGSVRHVRDTLAATGLPADQLLVELTEATMADGAGDLGRSLEALRSVGVRVAIDDFGTGHSALAYLRQLPVDVLKVDKTFIDDLESDDGQRTITRSVVEMARALGLTVVVEGIESSHQAGILRDLGGVLGQGFHLARPLSAREAGPKFARALGE